MISFMIGLAVLFVFYIILKILGFATKQIIKLLANGFVGLVLLVIGNMIAQTIGINRLDINLIHVIIASVLGIPGVILLFLFDHLL